MKMDDDTRRGLDARHSLVDDQVGRQSAFCAHCRRYYAASEEPDPCIGRELPGVAGCCCGHGDASKAYVDLDSGWAAACAGGYSGWNHKPGFVIVAVQSGEVTKFDSQCNGTTYGPNSPNGAVFVEYGDEPEEVRNMSGASATVYATLVAPDADPPVFRIEDDPPPCA
jgi:hypothetical protein